MKIFAVLATLSLSFLVLFFGCVYPADHPSDTGIDISLVLIPGGNFVLGWTGIANPTHDVSVSSFYMAKYETTYGQWIKVKNWAIAHDASEYTFIYPGDNTGDKTNLQPVITLSWYDAVLWCNALSEMQGLSKVYTIDKINPDPNNSNFSDPYKWTVTTDWTAGGYRLPTEAEWEYAARFENGFTWRPGDQWSGDTTVDTVSWYTGNAGGTTHEVGTDKKPGTDSANELGIYDMCGNVQEWCWDWFAPYVSSPENNPLGPVSGQRRIFRGGSWAFNAYYSKISVRNDFNPWESDGLFGFRVVKKRL